ncbi:MAG: hypothetical protein IPL79_04975 [Myxococcales bacterium]|nr:hypothetical protein [Myxococcales bacterium]
MSYGMACALPTSMTRSALRNILLSACVLWTAAPAVSQAAPQRARVTAKPFYDKLPNYLIEKKVDRSDNKVRKLTAKRAQLQASDPQAIRLDTKIARATSRGVKLRAKQAYRLSKAKQAKVNLDARRAAYAAKLGTRSTERLIFEQWFARNIVTFFNPMRTYILAASGGFAVAGNLMNEPLVSMASVALMGVLIYYPLVDDYINPENTFNRPPATTRENIAPYHAAELIKRGVVTPQNTLAVEIHEAGLQQELRGLKIARDDASPTSLP